MSGECTGEGRARAKGRGVKFGRPPVMSPHQRSEAIQRLQEGATQADLTLTMAYTGDDIAPGRAPFSMQRYRTLTYVHSDRLSSEKMSAPLHCV
jgi:hypothetical protein